MKSTMLNSATYSHEWLRRKKTNLIVDKDVEQSELSNTAVGVEIGTVIWKLFGSIY